MKVLVAVFVVFSLYHITLNRLLCHANQHCFERFVAFSLNERANENIVKVNLYLRLSNCHNLIVHSTRLFGSFHFWNVDRSLNNKTPK